MVSPRRFVASLLLCVAAYIAPGSARAEVQSCRSNFTGSFDAQKKLLFFGSARVVNRPIHLNYAIENAAKVGRAAGLKVQKPEINSGSGQASVYMVKSEGALAPLEVVITIVKPKGMIAVGTAMPATRRIDPEALREFLCTDLVYPISVETGRSSSNLGFDEMTADLVKDYDKTEAGLAQARKALRDAILSDPNSPEARAAVAEARTASRTAAPSREEKLRPLSPKQPFNAVQAEAALAEGTASIEGRACVVRNGQTATASEGEIVYLYPATPYLQEVVELMHGSKPGRDRLVLDPNFTRYRLEGRTNADGEFRFSRLRPGRYYLYGELATRFAFERQVTVGSYYDGYGSGNIVQNQQYNVNFDDVLEKFVDVKDGESAQIALTPRFRLLRSGFSFGCR